MDVRTVILFYNGTWVDRTTYIDYEVEGILIPTDCSHYELSHIVYEALNLDRNKYTIDLQFQVTEGIPPIRIKDDSGCKFYEQIRRKNEDETKYPIFVNISTSTTDNEHNDRVNYTDNGETSLQTRQLLPTRTEYATKMADYVIEQTQKSMEESSEANQIISNPQVKRSSKLDCKLGCIDDNCNWTFLASKHGKTDMFIIRKIEHTHTCSLDITSGDHPQATSNLVGKVIKNKFVNSKRDYTPTEIVDDMVDDYSVSISYQKAWRAREKTIVDACRCPQESYSEIPSILYMMQISNPGTITDLVTDEDNKFKYLYFAVCASIKGWQHCTPIIVTDRTFLTNQHGGTLLIASAQNANRHIFPLAFAVVDSENDSSWEWFLHKIKETYGEREGQCIVSDRHESILKAVKETFPDIMHGVCCYHLMKNIKMKFKKGGDELKIAFNSASKAYNIEDFEKSMQDLDNINVRIRDYLVSEIGVEKWTRLYGMNRRYKTMTSNIAELVNAALKAVRDLAIATLLECLHSLVQRWYWENKNRAQKTTTTLAKIPEKTLKKQRDMSLKYKQIFWYTKYTTTTDLT
ncbi:uncharacterized protein LOC115720472 [Cannabis sativa]|uniref:uncharacterized protein LOC115720472 n=1 Tax=Cannabis sativa TaxID=3483 RepID=UPI0029CA9B06|nr:uncharacterized protein LOC115720472 [Cannabis sativa]